MRTAIYVIYEKSQRLPQDVQHMISNLRSIVDYLIIVVNGVIDAKEILENYADILIIRENKGFDAGAYKTALCDARIRVQINKSDELIFCNDTFYGVFIPFEEIFDRMNNSEADFWGLNYSDDGFTHFIQSYFLVFRRSILEDNVLEIFFDENINENTTEIMDVLINFERGLFRYLVRKQYKYDTLCRQKYHIFDASDGSICYDKLPVLKKKAFSKRYYKQKVLLNCLKYIDMNYEYDVSMILSDIYSRYSIEILYDEVRKHEFNIHAKKMGRNRISREEILCFCRKFGDIYIYGMGKTYLNIKEILGFLDKDVIAGFIVSDDKMQNECFEGKKVYEISELRMNLDTPIIVAMNSKNTQAVAPYLAEFKNILLWE